MSQNTIRFNSFFQDTILDNNKIAVTDINAGLVNLFGKYNEYRDNFNEEQRYLVSEVEEGYPDLVSQHSILNNQGYWWWLILLNNLENPMTDIKANCVYSINNPNEIKSFVNKTNESTASSNDRIGKVLDLN